MSSTTERLASYSNYVFVAIVQGCKLMICSYKYVIGSPGKNGTYWKLIEGRLVVIFMQSYFRDPSKYPRA